MNFSPFPWLRDDVAVQAVLGTPPRAYPFGDVPQSETRPYVAWQLISGPPVNYLSERPDMDDLRYQFDCYAQTAADADAVAVAVRDALELQGHQVSHNGETRDIETRLYRISFDFEFWASR